EDAPIPAAPPANVVPLAAVFEGDPAHDESDQDDQQRQVEAGEQRRVPLRKGGEGGTAGDEQPHLVAVPDRADGVDEQPALAIVPAEHRQQDADAEIEALEQEIAGPEQRDEREPDGGELHFVDSCGQYANASGRSGDSSSESGGISGAPARAYLTKRPTSTTARMP